MPLGSSRLITELKFGGIISKRRGTLFIRSRITVKRAYLNTNIQGRPGCHTTQAPTHPTVGGGLRRRHGLPRTPADNEVKDVVILQMSVEALGRYLIRRNHARECPGIYVARN